MKLYKLKYAFAAGAMFLAGCTNMNKTGENMTEEETTVSSTVNSDMENERTAADVDTVTSPGSNSPNIKSGEYSSRDEQKQVTNDNTENTKGADKTK
jgi:PBP1b-binding outer membrane lipoprotein LpoB